MERYPPVSGLGVGAGGPALRLDYGLTPSNPLYIGGNSFDQEMPLIVHVHEGIEFGILLSGQQERRFGDYVATINAGDTWLVTTWEPHGWRISSLGSTDVVLMFLPDFLGEERLGHLSWLSLFAAPPAQRPQVTSERMREEILALGWQIRHEMDEQRPGWQSAVRLDLLRVLLTLSREWKPPAKAEAHTRVRASNLPRIMPALVLVHSERGRRVSVPEAARACGLGRAQFCLIFQETMGMSFGRFCLRSRLGYVAELLLSSDLPTSALADSAGFADGSHVHRAFVKHYGCTPGQYRAENRPALSAKGGRSPLSDRG